FSDETRHVPRPQIVTAACGGTDDEPDRLPLVVRSLGEQIGAPADQQRKKEEQGTLLCSCLKPRRSRWVLVTGFHLKCLKGSAILIRSGSVLLTFRQVFSPSPPRRVERSSPLWPGFPTPLLLSGRYPAAVFPLPPKARDR